MIDLSNQEGVFVLHMKSGENRFNLAFLDALDAALDEVERTPAAVALVTVGEGKFYSNGLDLDWMAGPGREQAAASIARVHELLGRVLTFPMITVAALNGHTFAAGAMLALAHDFRVMRDDRGFFCFPEVDIRIPFTPGMAAVIQAKLTPAAAVEAMTTGRRYGGADAHAVGLVTATASEDKVTSAAVDLVTALKGKDPGTLQAIKSTMFASVTAALRGEA